MPAMFFPAKDALLLQDLQPFCQRRAFHRLRVFADIQPAFERCAFFQDFRIDRQRNIPVAPLLLLVGALLRALLFGVIRW